MKKVLAAASLLLALALFLPTTGQGQNKGKNKGGLPGAQALPDGKEYERLLSARELTGKLSYVDAGSARFSLKMDFQTYEPNPKFKPSGGFKGNNWQQMQRMMRQQRRPNQRNVNPQQLMRQQMQMRMQMQRMMMQMASKGSKPGGGNQPYKVVTHSKDFEMEAVEKVVVRRLKLPTEFDEQGNVKKLTDAERRALRGNNPNLPGYVAKFGDLAEGQTIKVYLAGNQKKAVGLKADDFDLAGAPTPKVRMIVILQDASAGFIPQQKEGKKKKK